MAHLPEIERNGFKASVRGLLGLIVATALLSKVLRDLRIVGVSLILALEWIAPVFFLLHIGKRKYRHELWIAGGFLVLALLCFALLFSSSQPPFRLSGRGYLSPTRLRLCFGTYAVLYLMFVLEACGCSGPGRAVPDQGMGRERINARILLFCLFLLSIILLINFDMRLPLLDPMGSHKREAVELALVVLIIDLHIILCYLLDGRRRDVCVDTHRSRRLVYTMIALSLYGILLFVTSVLNEPVPADSLPNNGSYNFY